MSSCWSARPRGARRAGRPASIWPRSPSRTPSLDWASRCRPLDRAGPTTVMTTHTALAGRDAWLGEAMADSPAWVRELSAAALAEIDAALRDVRRRGVPWQSITRADFPLPSLGTLLHDVATELEHGCGMVKLRRIPVDRYDADALRQIYVGIASHIGHIVFQNRRGELMR